LRLRSRAFRRYVWSVPSHSSVRFGHRCHSWGLRIETQKAIKQWRTGARLVAALDGLLAELKKVRIDVRGFVAEFALSRQTHFGVDHTVKHECVETLHEIDDVTLLLSQAMLAESQHAERHAHSATERLAEWVEQSGVRDAGRALVLVGRRSGGVAARLRHGRARVGVRAARRARARPRR
jgi:hypothetical protein